MKSSITSAARRSNPCYAASNSVAWARISTPSTPDNGGRVSGPIRTFLSRGLTSAESRHASRWTKQQKAKAKTHAKQSQFFKLAHSAIQREIAPFLKAEAIDHLGLHAVSLGEEFRKKSSPLVRERSERHGDCSALWRRKIDRHALRDSLAKVKAKRQKLIRGQHSCGHLGARQDVALRSKLRSEEPDCRLLRADHALTFGQASAHLPGILECALVRLGLRPVKKSLPLPTSRARSLAPRIARRAVPPAIVTAGAVGSFAADKSRLPTGQRPR